MVLRPKAKDADIDIDQILVGDLAVVKEEVIEYHEPPSQMGMVAAFLLGLYCILRAIEFAASYGFTLRFASPRAVHPLDMRPVVIVYGLMAVFLMATASKFTQWFAPGHQWRVGKILTASFGWVLIMLSVQPLCMLATGNRPSGRLGNLFSTFMDYEVAAYGPFFIGILILLLTALPARVTGITLPEPD